MPKAYLSYTRSDRDAARSLEAILRANGFEVETAPDVLAAGMEYREVIDRAIRASEVVIVLWTQSALDSRFVAAEAYAAASQGKLLSVLADGVMASDLPAWASAGPTATLKDLPAHLRGWAGDAQESTDRLYRKRMETDEEPPTLGRAPAPTSQPPASQAARDEAYARRMARDDEPPSVAAAPQPGAFILNDMLSLDMLSAWTLAREAASATPAAASTPAPAPSEVREEAGGSSSSLSGAAILGAALVLVAAALPLFSRSVRDALGQITAMLGFKLNSFSLLGLIIGRSSKPQVDLVDCSVFAPTAAPPGANILVQVFLHQLGQAERASFQARTMDAGTTLKGVRSLSAEIERGASVDVALTANGLEITEPLQTVVWRGEPTFCQFLVTVPDDAEGKVFHADVRVFVAGKIVGRIMFVLATSSQVTDPRSVPSGVAAGRYRYVFVSYASEDRKRVLEHVQMLEATRTAFFQDILSLDPGDRWERKLYENIGKCDLFLLFWSEAAKRSEWVVKEAEYALSLQRSSPGGMPDIVPFILEGPPPVVPPPSLSSLHFNDRIRYFIAAS